MKVRETRFKNMELDQTMIDAWPTLREYIQYCAHTCGKPMMKQAGELDLSPSHWSRKLAGSPNDTMRVTVADLELWMEKNNDIRPLIYLVSKFLPILEQGNDE